MMANTEATNRTSEDLDSNLRPFLQVQVQVQVQVYYSHFHSKILLQLIGMCFSMPTSSV